MAAAQLRRVLAAQRGALYRAARRTAPRAALRKRQTCILRSSTSPPYLPSRTHGSPVATPPAELVWQIVKDNSCFLQKRKVPGRSQMGKMGPHFTTEPNNLAGINSWKYSGLANTKSVGIDAAAGGGVAFVTKTSKAKKIRKVRASRPPDERVLPPGPGRHAAVAQPLPPVRRSRRSCSTSRRSTATSVGWPGRSAAR